VAVVVGGGIEALGEFVLGLWRDVVLVFEDDDVVVIEAIADSCELFVCRI
jgi:hypothetical protein